MSLKLLAVMAAALALMPVGAASWSFWGGAEPSFGDDPAFQWGDPGAPGHERIYFAVTDTFGMGFGGGTTSVASLNVGALETRFDTYGEEEPMAILGAWVDCNRDGYIGMAETAVREYDAKLLTDTSACPPATGPPYAWDGSSHNYNGWVSELIPIGTGVGRPTPKDARVIVDPDVMIWGDDGHLAQADDAGPRVSTTRGGDHPAAKTAAMWTFTFDIVQRGDAPFNTLHGGPAGGTDPTFGVGDHGSGWSAESSRMRAPVLLSGNATQGQVAGATWRTYYAHVGTATTSRGYQLPGGAGTYASEACGSFTSGIHGGWDCDPLDWTTTARPGEGYQLRDVDCYDGGVGESGVGVEPAYYGARACGAS